jgi:hypothetical protein
MAIELGLQLNAGGQEPQRAPFRSRFSFPQETRTMTQQNQSGQQGSQYDKDKDKQGQQGGKGDKLGSGGQSGQSGYGSGTGSEKSGGEKKQF